MFVVCPPAVRRMLQLFVESLAKWLSGQPPTTSPVETALERSPSITTNLPKKSKNGAKNLSDALARNSKIKNKFQRSSKLYTWSDNEIIWSIASEKYSNKCFILKLKFMSRFQKNKQENSILKQTPSLRDGLYENYGP